MDSSRSFSDLSDDESTNPIRFELKQIILDSVWAGLSPCDWQRMTRALVGCRWSNWMRVLEIWRHMQYFADTGKFTMVFMEGGGTKEFECYMPPLETQSLTGFLVSATFLCGGRGNVIGNSQVELIYGFKVSYDLLGHAKMSAKQRKILTSHLE